jgi:acetolactate synthase-1/2/3 large subunit
LPSVADVIAEKAVVIATSERPGPVHIDVPITAADALIEEKTGRSRSQHRGQCREVVGEMLYVGAASIE